MTNHYDNYLHYKKRVDEILSHSIEKQKPESLYEPLRYVLTGGGKRIRPMMVIFSCEAYGGKPEDALNAAVAMEMLHNFTLVHDDIMDNADTRRGSQTVHKKWNENVAILTGDHLIGLAYSYLLKTNSDKTLKF
ncbi:MAG: polyprenyl synthetase family protein [Ignavibacteria bacterium]|nr:polyprenyl synthetase family protein [Ignavibacteria bacterium]